METISNKSDTEEAVLRPPSDWLHLAKQTPDETKIFGTTARENIHNAKQHNAKDITFLCLNRVNPSAENERDQYSEYLVTYNNGDCISSQSQAISALTPSMSLTSNHGTHGQGMKSSAFMLATPDDAHIIFLSRVAPRQDKWFGAEMKYIGGQQHKLEIKETELDFWIPYLKKHSPTVNGANVFASTNVIVLSRYVRGRNSAIARRKTKANSDNSIITNPNAMLLPFLSKDLVGKEKIAVHVPYNAFVIGEKTSSLGFETKGANSPELIKFITLPSLDSFYENFMLNGTKEKFVFQNFKYTDPANQTVHEYPEIEMTIRYIPTLSSGKTHGYFINFPDPQAPTQQGKHCHVYPQYNLWLNGDFEFGPEDRPSTEPVYFAKDSSNYLRRFGLYWAGSNKKYDRNKTNIDFPTMIDQLRRMNYPETYLSDMKDDGHAWHIGNDFMIELNVKPKDKAIYLNSCFMMHPTDAELLLSKFFDYVEDLMEANAEPVIHRLKAYVARMNSAYAPKRDKTRQMPKIGTAEISEKMPVLTILDLNLQPIKLLPCGTSTQTLTVFLQDKEGKLINNPNVTCYDANSGLNITDNGLDKQKRRLYTLQISPMQLFDGVDFSAVSEDEFHANLLKTKEDGHQKYRPWKRTYIKISNIPYKIAADVDIGETLRKAHGKPKPGKKDDPADSLPDTDMFEGNPWQNLNDPDLYGEYNPRKKSLVLNEEHPLFAGLHGYNAMDRRQKALEVAYFELKRQLDEIFKDGTLVNYSNSQGEIFEGRRLVDFLTDKLMFAKFNSDTIKKTIEDMVATMQ